MIKKIKFYWLKFTTWRQNRNAKFRNPLGEGQIRNENCLCGSQKKIKNCCGKEREISFKEFQRVTALINKAMGVIEAVEGNG